MATVITTTIFDNNIDLDSIDPANQLDTFRD